MIYEQATLWKNLQKTDRKESGEFGDCMFYWRWDFCLRGLEKKQPWRYPHSFRLKMTDKKSADLVIDLIKYALPYINVQKRH